MPLEHGPIPCLACFGAASSPGCAFHDRKWRVDNNPGYWGATDPEVLILGFSKGANQRSFLPFDRIAFNGARKNLAEILCAVGLLENPETIDTCFTPAETKLGFASVVRCGLGKEVEPGKYATSGDVIRAAIALDSPVRRIFETCTDRFLRDLPPSVRIVVFLGLDQPYIEAVFARMQQLHPSITRHGPLTYSSKNVRFSHVIHPSPLATSHRQSWLRDDTGLAEKRREVVAFLGIEPGTPASLHRGDRSAPARKRGTRTMSVSADRPGDYRIEHLIRALQSAIADGALDAQVIENQRGGTLELKKLYRIRRADGEEFAIQQTGAHFTVWSSMRPADACSGLEQVEEYAPVRSRHSNLSCMPKLRGPRAGSPGARVWKLRFLTHGAALDFIKGEPA